MSVYTCPDCAALIEMPPFIVVGWRSTCQGEDGHLIEFHLEANQQAELERLERML